MQRIILDTNIVVSALISKDGISAKIIKDLILEEKVTLCTSGNIMDEYFNVLRRDKFARYKDFRIHSNILMGIIETISLHIDPIENIKILKDLDDNKFLELAAELDVDYIITGNTKDYTTRHFRNTKIVTPAEYWGKHRPTRIN